MTTTLPGWLTRCAARSRQQCPPGPRASSPPRLRPAHSGAAQGLGAAPGAPQPHLAPPLPPVGQAAQRPLVLPPPPRLRGGEDGLVPGAPASAPPARSSRAVYEAAHLLPPPPLARSSRFSTWSTPSCCPAAASWSCTTGTRGPGPGAVARAAHAVLGGGRDTWWIVKGLLLCDMHGTARGILHNFASLIHRYGFIPNGAMHA